MNTATPDRTIDHGIDADLDEMLDAAVPPPTCEYQGKTSAPLAEKCGAPATWIMSLSCGHSIYYDDEHAEAVMQACRGAHGLACIDHTVPPYHATPLRVDARFDRIAS